MDNKSASAGSTRKPGISAGVPLFRVPAAAPSVTLLDGLRTNQ